MGQQHPFTSSGSKSRDTRGTKPSQDDVREVRQGEAEELADGSPKLESGRGLSGDSAGEQALDKGGAKGAR
jgi:hypothetical protein